MFFPVRTDRHLRHTPWVNYALVTVNVLVYVATHNTFGDSVGSAATDGSIVKYYLYPPTPQVIQFITYQFIHADLMHLGSNMVFLFAFGNSIEDRLGKIGYLAFYLAGGVLAGLGHAITSQAPVLGASGSVAAVTGAYLALFPLSNVTIVYWLFFVGAFEVSSIVLILFQIVQNVVMHMLGAAGVAYMAHLSGYASGFLVGIGLLWVRLLPREPYDLLALLEHRRRRMQFRRSTDRGYQPWDTVKPGATPKAGPPDHPLTEHEQQLMDLRRRVSSAVTDHQLNAAVMLYKELLDLDANQIMSEQQQLDISNQLMSEGQYVTAAHAYELFLDAFKGYAQREQIELILGLIYVKYIDRLDRGRDLLKSALPRLHDAQQRQLAEQMLKDTG